MYRIFLSFLFVLALLSTSLYNVYGQEEESGNRITDTLTLDIDLFANQEPASIDLKFNISEFLKRNNADEYMDAELTYKFSDSVSITKTVRVRARGNNRREVCRFPPLYINFKKSDLKSGSLADIDKIKFVTHCVQSKENNIYVLEEYLIYKMYNLVSEYSFRVRLARVRYIDTGRNNREYEGWGIFIEPEEMLAERVEAFPVKLDNLSYQFTEPWLTDIMSMFQYIIGNADYSIYGRQNIKLLKLKDIDYKYPVPVPYDFDYSGFVNANYAVTGGYLGIKTVRERYYLGPCRTKERFEEIINFYFELKDELYTLIESFEPLDKRDKKHLINYLDQYYNNVRKQNYIKNNLLTTCRDTL